MLGLDVYNAILVLRTEEAVKGFRTHNLTIGSDLGIAAGPLGAGISGEMGLKSAHKTPIFSYVQSRGFYAGLSLIGQAFLDRFDENERVYQ
jgi:lipid-binding SYLF domain-containing protein